MRCFGLVCAATIAVAFAAPAAAAPLNTMTDISAQTIVRKKRPQIRVTPLYPRYPHATTHSLYPRPYDFQYPGPHAKRECAARLVQEPRPSGTVAVWQTRCWWVRG